MVHQGRKSLDVLRIDPHTRRPKLVQRKPHVTRVPDHNRIQHQAERAELILLTNAVCLSQLAAATMEHTTSQTMPPFTRVDLNQQAATVYLVIHQIEEMEGFADAPILRQCPRHAGVAPGTLKSLHKFVSAHRAKFERAGHTQQVIPILSNEVGVDAMTGHAVQGSILCGWIDAKEAGVAKIRQAWAEAIAEQHEEPKHDVGVYMDVFRSPDGRRAHDLECMFYLVSAYAGSTTPAGREHRV